MDIDKESIPHELPEDTNSEVINALLMRQYLQEFLPRLKIHHLESYKHTLAVANLANALGEKLELPADDKTLLVEAALAHDLGKLNIPAELLAKKGELTTAERAELDRHIEYNRHNLGQYEAPENVMAIALAHHEDGSRSYPRNRTADANRDNDTERRETVNERIASLSHLLTIIDVFQALGAKRSYQPAEISTDRKEILCQMFPDENDQFIINHLLGLENDLRE